MVSYHAPTSALPSFGFDLSVALLTTNQGEDLPGNPAGVEDFSVFGHRQDGSQLRLPGDHRRGSGGGEGTDDVRIRRIE